MVDRAFAKRKLFKNAKPTLVEEGRAFVRAFRNAWQAEVGQDPRYSIVDYDDRDALVRRASDQITSGHRMETDLFLIRRNANVPVGYDRRVFLELKSGTTGVHYDWFFHRTIVPRYDEARGLHRRVAYEQIPPIERRDDVFDLNAAELWRYIVLDENGVFDGGTPEDHAYVDFYIAVAVYAGFRAPERGRLFAQWIRDIRIWAPYCPRNRDPEVPENIIANVDLARFGTLSEILCQGLEMEPDLALAIEQLTCRNALNEPLLGPVRA